ncbi:Mannose-binding lectin [Rhynchospora pubera]|uniref:non-specific serine/threonine protein kinase n=1 Tax=Rhynchospora pubera TaxID=906938 RepID=A0AAV8FZS5_9POAL|nr:Mannose-binding lectin [Rhynchospora pubera]
MASPSLLNTFFILSATLALLAPSFANNILYSGEFLYGGQSLTEGSYTFTMQTDCNLVLYDNGRAIWASRTYQKGENCYLSMQDDGNLVIYDFTGTEVLWSSNTQRSRGNFVVVLQRDRNVVLYGPSLWATGTNHVGTTNVTIAHNFTAPVVIAGDKISMVTDHNEK